MPIFWVDMDRTVAYPLLCTGTLLTFSKQPLSIDHHSFQYGRTLRISHWYTDNFLPLHW